MDGSNNCVGTKNVPTSQFISPSRQPPQDGEHVGGVQSTLSKKKAMKAGN